MNPLLAARPLFVAQDELLDLAGRGLGQVAELDGGGGLEAGDVLLAEVYDLLLGRLLALLQDNERLGTLAPFLVGHRDDGGLHHRRVLGDGLFDLDGRDVLAAGDDDVLVAVPDLDVPVRVPHGDVSGVVPTTLEGLVGRLLVLEVALGDHVAVHHDLAHRLPVARDVVHVLVHDAHEIGGGVALPLPGHEPRPLLHLQGLPLRVNAAGGDRAVGLGEAIDVHRIDVQLEEATQKGGGGGGAGYRRGHGGVERVGGVLVDYPDLECGSGAVVGYPLRLEELPDAWRLDLPEADVRRRDGRNRPGVGPAVAVKHRERPQILRLVAHPGLDNVAQRAQVRAAMGVHHALRPSGGTRGVVYGYRLLLVLQHAHHGLWRPFGQVVLVGVAPLVGVVYTNPLDPLVHVREQLLELGVDEDHLRPRVLDDVLHLVLAEAGVYGHEHQPPGGHGEVCLQLRRRVETQERHPVPLLEPRVAQARGEGGGAG